MPKVPILTNSGPARINYVISTPANPSADHINPSLPTVLLLHPVYFGQVIFHAQFSDVRLRRFNLIAPDMRGHGETGGEVKKTWGCNDAAEDIVAFMDALKLPPCHFFGVSMGSCVALQVAMLCPEKALSAFLVSPLSAKEEYETAKGRLEILNAWIDTFSGAEVTPKWDQSLLEHAEYGALQLAYNNLNDSLLEAIHKYTTPQSVANFGPGKFDTARAITVNFFVELPKPTREELRKIKCPVMLVFCGGDVAYTLQSSREIQKSLQGAGVDARLVTVDDAPRFGIVTHPDEINQLFLDFISQHTSSRIPPAPPDAKSPFADRLEELGWVPEGRSQSSESISQIGKSS